MFNLAVEFLRLIPLVLAYYLPAMLALILLRERGSGYRVKAPAILALGFGIIIYVKLLLQPGSEYLGLLLVSAIQISLAMLFAFITVYKLAD